jgi:hypothetical protein
LPGSDSFSLFCHDPDDIIRAPVRVRGPRCHADPSSTNRGTRTVKRCRVVAVACLSLLTAVAAAPLPTAAATRSAATRAAAPAAADAAIVGKTFELAEGDDPVEAFAVAGLSVAGASYVMAAPDGTRFRVDRAAKGRAGFVVVSRAVKELRGGRAEWQVTDAVAVAVDSSDAFTSECRSGSGSVAFLFYEPAKKGNGIGRAEAGFLVDAATGKVERAKLAAADCRPGRLAAAPRE